MIFACQSADNYRVRLQKTSMHAQLMNLEHGDCSAEKGQQIFVTEAVKVEASEKEGGAEIRPVTLPITQI